MTKYWKVSASQGGKSVELFTKTSDEAVALDLPLGSSGSLIISTGARYEGNEHFYLAMGAFWSFIRGRGVLIGNATEITGSEFPTDATVGQVGGTTRSLLMSIWRKEE